VADAISDEHDGKTLDAIVGRGSSRRPGMPPDHGRKDSIRMIFWEKEKEMKHTPIGFKIIGLLAFLVVAGFCGCASSEVQKSSAEKAREAWYSNYIDNTEKEWSTHF
jgi:hypothetical protein